MAMTDEKLRKLFRLYGTASLANDQSNPRIRHVAGMMTRALKLVDDGRREKAMRWLGFMQGVMWLANIYSLEELKLHSKPDDEEYKEDA